jgi:hypothetical protein
VVGKINSTFRAIFSARLHSRALLRDKIQALKQSNNCYYAHLTLSQEARDELQWWIDNLEGWNGRSLIPDTTEITLTTDASNTGWGAVLGPQRTGGFWTYEERQKHINLLEIRAIEFGLRSFVNQLKGKSVLIQTDNTTAMAHVNHMGGTRSEELSRAAEQLWCFALTNKMRLQATHIPGELNTEADEESRQGPDSQDWMLNREIFHQLNQWWGPFQIDLFASRANAQLHRFFSWRPDPFATGIDAFQQDWTNLHAYANPPWILMPRVLTKIRRDKASVLLIAPVWPSQPWYPTLLQMLVDQPWLLPQREDLFLPGFLGNQPPVNAPQWQVAAWPLSGDNMKQKAFQATLPPLSPTDILNGLPSRMGPRGVNLVAGVVQNRLILFYVQ